MSTPNTAIIEGTPRKVIGFDKEGNLVLAGGRLYALMPLAWNAEILCRPLLEVAKLRRENGAWIWNESDGGFSKWLRVRSLLKPDDLSPEDATFLFLWHALKKLDAEVQAQVNGVAWFNCDDGAGGWNTPVLLKVFRAVAGTGNTAAAENAELRKLEAKLKKAESAAAVNLQEALSKWMRFDPPHMAADTKARVTKAVLMYMTDADRRSLRKVGKEFGVSAKTVSTWFEIFRRETGFKVVTFKGHESVKARKQAELEPESDGVEEEE